LSHASMLSYRYWVPSITALLMSAEICGIACGTEYDEENVV